MVISLKRHQGWLVYTVILQEGSRWQGIHLIKSVYQTCSYSSFYLLFFLITFLSCILYVYMSSIPVCWHFLTLQHYISISAGWRLYPLLRSHLCYHKPTQVTFTSVCSLLGTSDRGFLHKHYMKVWKVCSLSCVVVCFGTPSSCLCSLPTRHLCRGAKPNVSAHSWC